MCCLHCTRSIRFFSVHFAAKRYILQQKCLRGQIGTCLLGTRWYNFYPRISTMRATVHNVTDRQTDDRWTDRRHAYANSRSYCVAVRSANNNSNLVLLAIVVHVVRLHNSSSSSSNREIGLLSKNGKLYW